MSGAFPDVAAPPPAPASHLSRRRRTPVAARVPSVAMMTRRAALLAVGLVPSMSTGLARATGQMSLL